jgi:hypothetical protein
LRRLEVVRISKIRVPRVLVVIGFRTESDIGLITSLPVEPLVPIG